MDSRCRYSARFSDLSCDFKLNASYLANHVTCSIGSAVSLEASLGAFKLAAPLGGNSPTVGTIVCRLIYDRAHAQCTKFALQNKVDG